MYRNILVSVDGSVNSQLALREAIRLAKDQNAKLRLVHVVDPASNPYMAEYAYTGHAEDSVRHVGETILREAKALAMEGEVQAETVMLDADDRGVANVIADEAGRWPADLVVLGTHGRIGVRRLVLGSVAEGVIRISPAPVLLVREQ